MNKQIVSTTNAPAAVGVYSQAVRVGNTIWLSGQIPLDPETNKLVVSNVKPHPAVAQGNAAWMLLKAFCSEFGLSPVSRTRLTVEKAVDSEDELIAILSQPRERKQQTSGEVIQ